MTTATQPATDGARILVVEDSGDFRLLLETVLTDAGYVVDSAETSEAALSLLEDGDYDLLLSDYSLPGHSGAWLVARVKQRTAARPIPAMIITGDPDAPGIPRDQPVVPKPVDFERLLGRIRKMLANDASHDSRSTGRFIIPPRSSSSGESSAF